MNPRQSSTIGLGIAILSAVALTFQNSFLAVGVVAIAVQILAALLMLWARLTFGLRSFHASADPTEGGLVTSGPYRYLRHPIYAAILYFFGAGILSHISLSNVLFGLGLTIGLFMRIFAEENLVRERYPAYADYASRTKRIIPFVF
jgi:protein-S-isoprenylcysteine O-methyltransferase Ste14